MTTLQSMTMTKKTGAIFAKKPPAIFMTSGKVTFSTVTLHYKKFDDAMAELQAKARLPVKLTAPERAGARGSVRRPSKLRSPLYAQINSHVLAQFAVLSKKNRLAFFARTLAFAKNAKSLVGLESLFASGMLASAQAALAGGDDASTGAAQFADGASFLQQMSAQGGAPDFSDYSIFDGASSSIAFLSGASFYGTAGSAGLGSITDSPASMGGGIGDFATGNPALSVEGDEGGGDSGGDDGSEGASGGGGSSGGSGGDGGSGGGGSGGSDGGGAVDETQRTDCEATWAVGGAIAGEAVTGPLAPLGALVGFVGGEVASSFVCTGSKPAPSGGGSNGGDTHDQDGDGENDATSHTMPSGPGVQSYVGSVAGAGNTFQLHGMPQLNDDGDGMDTPGILGSMLSPGLLSGLGGIAKPTQTGIPTQVISPTSGTAAN